MWYSLTMDECLLKETMKQVTELKCKAKAKSKMGLRGGDIIWARVQFPQKWWPGLVLRIKGHWVAVSFFNDNKKSRHYFLETEVCSFQENFESLVKTLKNSTTGVKLLDFALKLLARRVYSSFKCSCRFLSPRENGKISRRMMRKDLFECDVVLGFVLDLAVKPFIGVSDLVYAVTSAAKINAFRRYTVGACSVSQKCDASKLEFEPLNEDQPHCRSWIETEQTKTLSLHEQLVILRHLAVDTGYIRGKCLNTVEQNVLIFRNLAYQTSINPIFEKCSLSTSSHHQYIKSQPSVKVDGNNCIDASSNKLLGLKRHIDQPVSFDLSLKLGKTLPLVSINGADVYLKKRKIALNVCLLDALISKPAFSALSLKFCNTIFNKTDAYLHLNGTVCEPNKSDALISGSKLEVVMLDNANAGTKNYLPSHHTTDQIQREPSIGDYRTYVETNEQVHDNGAFGDNSMDNMKLLPVVTSDASFKPKEQQLHPVVTDVPLKPKEHQRSASDTLSHYQYLHMKFPKDFNLPSKDDLIRKFSRFGKVDSFRTKIFTCLGSAQVVFLHHLDAVTAYQYAKRKKILSGEANILYWLDACERKRRGSQLIVPLPNLKPCLKKSDRKHGQEDKKHTKRVRFIMQT